METAAAAGPQPVAQQAIASGGIAVDLSESEDDFVAVEALAPAGSAGDLVESEDDTAAVEEHAEGGHFTTLTGSGCSFVDRDHITPH